MKEKMIGMLESWLNDFIVPLGIAVVIFIVGLIIISLIISSVKKSIFNKYDSIEESNYSKKVADIVGSMLYYILVLFNVLIAFQIVGLNVAILMAGISFGIGFGMEKTLSNMLAGVMLITNPKIKAGETITLLGSYNVMGKIEKMSARNTIIRLPSKSRLILPNTKVTKTAIRTHSQEQIIKAHVDVSIDLEADIQLAKTLIRQLINDFPDVIQKEQTFINIENTTETGIQIRAYFHLYPKGSKKSGLVIKSEIRIGIINAFRKNNISIPYPHQVLNIE